MIQSNLKFFFLKGLSKEEVSTTILMVINTVVNGLTIISTVKAPMFSSQENDMKGI